MSSLTGVSVSPVIFSDVRVSRIRCEDLLKDSLMVPPDSCPRINQETLFAGARNKGKEGRFPPVIETPEAIIKPQAWFGTKFGGWHQRNKGFKPGPRNQVNRTP
jgi:hypothetical protein